jgi:uncharacterized protein with FMN-binding domain
MDRSTLSWLATILAILGAAIITGHPAWGAVTGLAILLMAAAIAAGTVGTRSASSTVERRLAGQKIPNSLVTLSSAAILAVYAAGYHRTGSAADEFEARAARHKTAAPVAATATAPRATTPKVEAHAIVVTPVAPRLKKDHPRPLTAVPTAPPPPTEDSRATPLTPLETAATNDPLPEPAAPSPAVAPQLRYKDGTYLGWGTCRHGDIQASVVVQNGKIVSTAIAQCLTRYSCSWIVDLPGQVVSRQNSKVDYVSGATQSSDAFSDAVADALSKASE